MVIFKYITEKDVFQKFYRNLLANRLVNDTSVSHDLEGSMISKLKVLDGDVITAVLFNKLSLFGVLLPVNYTIIC